MVQYGAPAIQYVKVSTDSEQGLQQGLARQHRQAEAMLLLPPCFWCVCSVVNTQITKTIETLFANSDSPFHPYRHSQEP